MPFQLASSAFDEGGKIPVKYTEDGANVSPPLQWENPPQGAQSFTLILEDPDAPAGIWVHWVLYGIPGDAVSLPEAIEPQRELPNGTRQGRNDFQRIGYGGPAPPPGGAHRYVFTLHALDVPLNLEPGATKTQLLPAMEEHVLEEARLIGLYAR